MVKTRHIGHQDSKGAQTLRLKFVTPNRKAIKSFPSLRRGDAMIKAVRIFKKSGINPAFKAVSRVRKSVVVENDEKPKIRFEKMSIAKKAFQVVCKEFAHSHVSDCRFTKEALKTLQLAVEDFIVGFFEDAVLCVNHANRKTLMKQDMLLVCRLRKVDYIPL